MKKIIFAALILFFMAASIGLGYDKDIAATSNGGVISCDNEQVGGECRRDIDGIDTLGWTCNTGSATAVYQFNDNYTIDNIVQIEHCYRSGTTPANYSCWDTVNNVWGTNVYWWENNTGCEVGDIINISIHCSTDKVRFIYPNLGSGTEFYGRETYIYNTTPYVDIIPVITFINQTPSDIRSTNAFSNVTVYYDIDPGSYAVYSAEIYSKINASYSDTIIHINGTSIPEAFIGSGCSYISDNDYKCSLEDGLIYPATYNYDQELMEFTQHQNSTLSTNGEFISIGLHNVSSDTAYNIFEIMLSRSSGSGIGRFYYCNSSYSFNNPPVSDVCYEFYDEIDFVYNHSHSLYSSHLTIPFIINVSDKTSGGIHVTPDSYFIVRGQAGSVFDYHHINKKGWQNAAMYSSDGGLSWAEQDYIVDSHMHQYDGTEEICYYLESNSSYGFQNSALRCESIDLDILPPSSPIVYSPSGQAYINFLPIWINYTEAASFNDTISYYNITLLNTDFSYNITLKSNNSVNLTWLWKNDTFLPSGNFIVQVKACDSSGSCSSGFSDNFSIIPDIINPGLVINLPLNNSAYYVNYTDVPIDIICTDEYPYLLNMTVSKDGNVLYSLQNVSGVDGVLTIKGQFNTTNITDTGFYYINATCSDGHTYFDPKIADKSVLGSKISYTTEKGDKIDIMLSSSDNMFLCRSGSDRLSDREAFWYDFSCNPDKQPSYRYEFNVSNDWKYLPESPYKAHFISKDHFITFGCDTCFDYKIVENKENYVVSLSSTSKFLYFNHSVGAINTVKSFVRVRIIEKNIITRLFTTENMLGFIAILFFCSLLAFAPFFFKVREIFLLSGAFTVAMGIVCYYYLPTLALFNIIICITMVVFGLLYCVMYLSDSYYKISG